jgi:serine/threonine-protein kinase HipA
MKKIDIYYSGWGEAWKLGQLAESDQSILFEYTPEALRQKLELSPLNLKLRAEAYGNFPAHQMNLPGLISDSLPDGWGLLLMDRLFRKQGLDTSSVSPLDRLAFLGDRAMGALSFVPASEVALEPKDFTLLEIAKGFQKIIEDHPVRALPQLALLGGSPQGARPKVLVAYNPRTKLISTRSPSTESWLVKFPAKGENKEVSAIEALYAQCAEKAGIDVPDTEYFDLGKTFSAFGTKRFDRKGNYKIPIHTLAGLLNADFRIPSSVDYLTFLRLIRYLTNDEREVIKGYTRCVFNVIFHNRDDHPKNFSFLIDKNRNWSLTPAYDLTFSQGPNGEHHMDICGEGKLPDKDHLSTLAEKSSIDSKTANFAITQVIEVAQSFKKEAKTWPIRTATVNTINQVIQNNVKRLL